jgi:hypothetical protein
MGSPPSLNVYRAGGQRIRYDATHGVHLQVPLHRRFLACRLSAAQGDRGRRKGCEVDLARSGVQASRLRAAAWRKSRHSNPSGNCVEIAELTAGRVAIRDSRHPDGPALIFTQAEWAAFLRDVRDGEFG